MGDLGGAIVKANPPVSISHPEGTIIPPRGGAVRQIRHELASPGIPYEQFRPGDPLYETASEAMEFKEAAKSEQTKRAYLSDFRLFATWCAKKRLDPLPATTSTIGLYITDLASNRAKVSTISRKMAAIAYWHKDKGLPSPCSMRGDRQLSEVYAGIRRTLGVEQSGKEAITVELVRKMLDNVEGALAAARDRALLLIGFAGGLRRSELAAIDFKHLDWHSRGLTISIPRSKTDQDGAGREVEIARGSQPESTPVADCTCPVRALNQWLNQASIKSGPVFCKVEQDGTVQRGKALNPASVAWILKRALKRAGVRNPERFGAHSLRAGFATTAFDNGVSEYKIRQQTGHKTTRMLEKYIRSNKKARQEAASSLGL